MAGRARPTDGVASKGVSCGTPLLYPGKYGKDKHRDVMPTLPSRGGLGYDVSMKRLFALAGLAAVVLLSPARTQGQDDEYVRIYNLIQQGDSLSSLNKPGEGAAKYQEAQTALQRLQRGYPHWNVSVVNYRMNYLAARIA